MRYGKLSDGDLAKLIGYLQGTDFDVLIRNFEGTDDNPYVLTDHTIMHLPTDGTATQLLPIGPVTGTTAQTDMRLLVTEYGDGYTQRTADGLNYLRDMVTLRWTHKSVFQWRVIRDFFKGDGTMDLPPKLGVRIITYTLYGEELAKRWRCTELRGPTPEHGNLYTFSVKLVEEFGNGG